MAMRNKQVSIFHPGGGFNVSRKRIPKGARRKALKKIKGAKKGYSSKSPASCEKNGRESQKLGFSSGYKEE